MTDCMLPAAFAELEPFAPAWCLATEKDRYTKRLDSTISELREFYDAAMPRFADAMAHLDKFPLKELPEPERNLLNLVYSEIVVSLAVDMFDQPQVIDCGNACFFRTLEPVP